MCVCRGEGFAFAFVSLLSSGGVRGFCLWCLRLGLGLGHVRRLLPFVPRLVLVHVSASSERKIFMVFPSSIMFLRLVDFLFVGASFSAGVSSFFSALDSGVAGSAWGLSGFCLGIFPASSLVRPFGFLAAFASLGFIFCMVGPPAALPGVGSGGLGGGAASLLLPENRFCIIGLPASRPGAGSWGLGSGIFSGAAGVAVGGGAASLVLLETKFCIIGLPASRPGAVLGGLGSGIFSDAAGAAVGGGAALLVMPETKFCINGSLAPRPGAGSWGLGSGIFSDAAWAAVGGGAVLLVKPETKICINGSAVGGAGGFLSFGTPGPQKWLPPPFPRLWGVESGLKGGGEEGGGGSKEKI